MIKPKNLLPKSVTSAIGRWIPGLHVACKHLRSHVFKLGLVMAGNKRNNQISISNKATVLGLPGQSKMEVPIFQDTVHVYIIYIITHPYIWEILILQLEILMCNLLGGGYLLGVTISWGNRGDRSSHISPPRFPWKKGMGILFTKRPSLRETCEMKFNKARVSSQRQLFFAHFSAQ